MKQLMAIFFTLSLSACQQIGQPFGQQTAEEKPYDNGQAQQGVQGAGYYLQGGNLFDSAGNKIPRIFFFPLDSYQVSAVDRQAIVAHAKFLRAAPKVKVKVEGHGDERGSREYNLALGQRRAQAVATVLSGSGVSGSQIVSYGEERPLDFNRNEAAWQKNRRVELLY